MIDKDIKYLVIGKEVYDKKKKEVLYPIIKCNTLQEAASVCLRKMGSGDTLAKVIDWEAKEKSVS